MTSIQFWFRAQGPLTWGSIIKYLYILSRNNEQRIELDINKVIESSLKYTSIVYSTTNNRIICNGINTYNKINKICGTIDIYVYSLLSYK